MLLWNPLAVIGGYLAVGVVLMISRWLIPAPPPVTQETTGPVAENDAAAPPLPLAA